MWVSDRAPNVEDAYNILHTCNSGEATKDDGLTLKLNTWITNPHHKGCIILEIVAEEFEVEQILS